VVGLLHGVVGVGLLHGVVGVGLLHRVVWVGLLHGVVVNHVVVLPRLRVHGRGHHAVVGGGHTVRGVDDHHIVVAAASLAEQLGRGGDSQVLAG
jgi:hypothetical protein